jgi:hypothetical protein
MEKLEQKPDLSTIQERHPDWPQLELEFYFAPHGIAEDMEGIISKIKDADILFYEDYTRSAESIQNYNIASKNPSMKLERLIKTSKTDEDLPLKGSPAEPLVRGLYKTSVEAATMDIGKTEYERAIGLKLDELLDGPRYAGIDYETTLSMLRDDYAEITRLQNEREDIMVGNFEEEVDKILARRLDLADKKSLKILVSMGSYHTRLEHLFKRQGMKTEHTFSSPSPYIYNYVTQLERALAFDKEPSHELLQRAFTQILLENAMDETNKEEKIKADDLSQYERRIVASLHPETMEAIYELWSSGELTTKGWDDVLKASGHKGLPRSNVDIYEELGIPNPVRKKGLLAKAAIIHYGR